MRPTGNIKSDNEIVFGEKVKKYPVTPDMQQIIDVMKQEGYKLYQDRTTFDWYLGNTLVKPFTYVKVSLYNPTAKALLGRGLIKRVNRSEDRQTDFQYILRES